MAEYGDQIPLPASVASGDLSACRHHFVKYLAANVIMVANSAADTLNCGVLQNAPKNGEHASVAGFGAVKLTMGNSCGANALITTTASGRGTPAASGNVILGRALEAAAADGEIVSAFIFPVSGRVAV